VVAALYAQKSGRRKASVATALLLLLRDTGGSTPMTTPSFPELSDGIPVGMNGPQQAEADYAWAREHFLDRARSPRWFPEIS
jgi:hypothetical protein